MYLIMETISEYIHYNIFRKMCDPQINQPNNCEVKVECNKKPDIEMGYKLQRISGSNKIQVKPTKFEKKTMDILNCEV